MTDEISLRNQAIKFFFESLRAVDSAAAVRGAVKLSDSARLTVVDEVYEITKDHLQIYVVALGKAAYPMALALNEILGDKIIRGIISGSLPPEYLSGKAERDNRLSGKWRVFAGGHPLPNEASLAAARSAISLLREVNHPQALVIFLISGGGSAMIEAPVDNSITLADLREANRNLVSCGASIAEINTVRRAFSSIKGGGLASVAPNAVQISLIVSDTEPGDESLVASGPTFENNPVNPDEVRSIVKKCNLASKLPNSVLKVILSGQREKSRLSPKNRHYVLLDNQSAVSAAAAAARDVGFIVEIADDLTQQPVEIGCQELARRMQRLRQNVSKDKVACLISGGEFSCPVRGNGVGGRNAETALRMALMLGENTNPVNSPQTVFLSAGTDGIDGNSPSAGAVSDNTTLARAKALGLDARRHLENSDAHTFFQALGDTIITGPTGTNVRDLRIMLAG